jgi:CshA-type fibril repeat protein
MSRSSRFTPRRLQGPKYRLGVIVLLAFGMVTSSMEVPPASALTGLDLVVDYTPDSATVATSALRGTKIDLTASTPVAVAGTTQQEIVQQIDPELDLRSAADITAPAGWTVYYSNDGNTWTPNAPTTLAGWEALRYVKANGPLVSEGADSSGRQISSSTASGLQPDSGQFSTANTASGDGWDVFFDDMKHVYNIWHHRDSTSIDCHLRTGLRCDGSWPYALSSTTTYNAATAGTFQMSGSYNSTGWYDSVAQEIWIPTVYTRGISGVANSSVGFACISVANISATTKWCGGSVSGGGFVSPGSGADFLTSSKCSDALYDCQQGFAQSGGRIFTWATKTGDLVCVDIRLNSGAGGPCASGGVIDFGSSLPDGNNVFFYPTLGAWDGRIYGNVNDSTAAGYAVCLTASTGAACPGWTNPRASSGGLSRYTTLPALTTGGAMRGACLIGIGNGIATRVNCYDAAGADISSTLTAEFLTAYKTVGMGAYSNYNPAHDTRMYWGGGQASGGPGIHCWDFALNSWCVNWTASGIADTNYQIALDPMKPTCIWSNADDTIIQTYNATTGTAGNCAMPAPTVNFDGGMQLPRMACSTTNAIQSWRSFTLVTAVTYTSATFTVKNSSGSAIAAWTNVTVPGSKIIDLSTLPIADTGQTPTFSVTFNGRTDEGDVSAKISAVGGSPELCLRPTVACPYPIVHPSQLLANSVPATASGSTTASGTVSQFDPVTRTVNIANTPTSNCATSLSGTLTTGAGAAVAGVLVTLADSSGAPLTYPTDYPDVALRGQFVTTTSDASGVYSFPLVAAGDYKVKFVDASGSVLVNQAIITASGSGMSTDYTTATSLLSPTITLAVGTEGVVDAKYNSSQSLSKSFWPTSVNAGQVSTLTFTISNTSLAAKTGIGWVDSLPAGLVVDDNPNKRTTCAGGTSETLNPTAMSAVAGATSISVSGASINANVASCTYSVNVKATAAGDYRNGPSNVTTTAIDKNTDATLEALAPGVPGETLCDNNVFYLEAGQLYRHAADSLARYAVGPTYTSGAVDAIGYNSADGFLYGIARTTSTSNGVTITAGHLVRISGAGIMSDLGSMTGTGITDTVMATAVAGDFDNSGNLVVKATGSKTTLYSINVSTRAVTTITTSVAIQGDDLAYSKGAFYSSFGLFVYKATVSAGTTWTSTSTNMFPSNISAHQTTYSDGTGRVVFVDGNRKAYELLDPSTASASTDFTNIYTYVTNPLDGAMCHAAPLPTANADTSSGGKNVAQTKNLLTNDTVASNASGVTLIASSVKLCDPNSNPVETSPNCTKGLGTSITVANVGTYSVDATGVVTFTPALDYLGTPPALDYQVADSMGNIATSTYTPTVLNTVPSATNDTSTGAYDTNQTISPLTNDTAGSLAPIDATSVKLCATTSTANASCSLTSLTVANEGTYTVNANGTVTFDPLPTFTGTASPVKYVMADTLSQLTNATITPTVSAPPAPSATPQSKAVIPGGTVSFTTLTGASGLATAVAGFNTNSTCLITPGSSPATCDADGIVTVANEGTYTLNAATGVVTFVAAANVTPGTKTALNYQVTDMTGQVATSTLTPTIAPAPTATNDTSTGAYDTNQTISPLANDAAGSGATLTASSVKLCATTSTANASCNLTTLTVVNQGTYTVNANGTVTFDPLPTFTGPASPVKYVVADSTTQLASATITPTVTAPAVPVATPESKAVIPGGTATFTVLTGAGGLSTSAAGIDTSLTCLLTPSTTTCDADGVVAIAGEGTYTLDVATGIVTYVADVNATQGTKTPITYRVTDITGQTATSTLTPVIPAPPVAVNDTSTGAYDTNQTINILTNDIVTSPAMLVESTVKLCATTSTANASCNLTTLTIAGEGTYTVNANGTVTFDPLPTFTGTASPVKYAVQDTTGQLTGATITPTVSMPALPVATPESKAVIPGGTATFTTLTGTGALATSGVGLNASVTCLYTPSTTTCDADGVVTIAGQGTYTLDAATGIVTYVADVNATQGTKTPITYKVTDIFGQTATSTLTPVIPAPPVGVNDTSTGAYDTNQTISILTNDTTTSPATLVASSVKLCATTGTANASCNLTTLTVANQGTYTVNANGTVTFDPLPTFVGTASPVKYAVQDSTGQLTGATITPTVSMPAAPVATPESKAVIPGGSVSFTTLTGTGALATSGVGLNASVTCLYTPSTTTCDSDGIVTIAGEGTYTLDIATGVVTFVADANATQGTKTSITYKVTDIFGQTATSTLTPVIPAPPVAVNDTSTGPFDTNQTITILTNDSATSPATLLASTVKLCATTGTANASCNLTTLTVANQGTYTVNANGTVTFDPLPTFVGTASPVKYVVADTTGQLANATITPTVSMPAAPVATPQTKTVIPGGTATFTTLTGTGGLATTPAAFNTSVTCLLTPSTTTCDADGIITIASEGTYTLDTATGIVTFVADVNATVGAKTPLTYKVTDIFGQTATSTLTPIIPAPPAAVNDLSTGAYDTNQVISPLTNDSAVAPATLVPSSVRLCANVSTAISSCTLTTLTVGGEGTYTVNANGTVTFDPLPTFIGTAAPVKYVVADINGRVASATITPTVLMPPPPVATPETRSVAPASTVSFQAIVGSGANTLAAAAVGGAALNASTLCIVNPATNVCGTTPVTIAGEGTYTVDVATGTISYSSEATAPIGSRMSITYKITDIFGQTVTSTLTPVIPPVPAIANDSSTGPWNTAQTLVPVTNDAAGAGTTLVASSIKLCVSATTTASTCTATTLTVPGEGTYTVLANGNVRFVPLATFWGAATPIKYSIADAVGQMAMATIEVVVTPPTSKPVAKPQKLQVNRGETVLFTNITGKLPLASSKLGLVKANTCLVDPNPAPVAAADASVCDADGIVTVKNLGTFKLNKKTGVVSFTASKNAKAGQGLSVTYQVTDISGQTAQSKLTPIIPEKPQLPTTGVNSAAPLALAALMLITVGVALRRSKKLTRHLASTKVFHKNFA